MTLWLLLRGLRRAPRRLFLGAIGVAFPVAVLAATLFFVDVAVLSLTRLSLEPVQVEMRAISTSLDTNLTQLGQQLGSVPGVTRVERFASADVVVTAPGGTRATARLFAVDPPYLAHHPWVHVVSGTFAGGALLTQNLRTLPGVAGATHVSIALPGQTTGLLQVPVDGTVDLRDAFTWFSIATGEVQGDIALVPRSIVIDYASFRQAILPALRRTLGSATAALNPGLTSLPPVSVEDHITVAHGAYPSDPAQAANFSGQLRRTLERRGAGSTIVADNASEPLIQASTDATNARILFILLGIPGVIAAAVLGLATEAALAEAQRREEALLRLRGATDGQLVRLATTHAGVAAVAGSVLGLVAATAAVKLAQGQWIWTHVPARRIAVSVGLALLAGALVTGGRLYRLRHAGSHSEVVTERQLLQRGWSPTWRRAYLDVAAIALGLSILLLNALGGGLKQAAVGTSLALSFYVLLAPIALWVGVTLFAIRLMLGWLARRARTEQGRPLRSWGAAGIRWLGRRPARMAVALVLGSLAVGYGTEVIAFVATYRSARHADTQAAFGSDLRFTPSTEASVILPAALPGVAATTPIHFIPARVGSDRKTILAVDPATYLRSVRSRPIMLSGGGLEALRRNPLGVVVADEIAKDFVLRPGDKLPLTVYPDDEERSRPITLVVTGVYRSIPPGVPPAELVINQRALPAFLIGQADFHLGRVNLGLGANAVAADLRRAGIGRGFKVTTQRDLTRFGQPSLTALNLGPLSDIESIAAGLIAAVGVAALGAFMVLERRREYAILRAAGADTAQLLTGPGQEGLITVVGSIAIGLPVGLGLGILAVRVLSLLFTLPPPILTIPIGTLLVFVGVMVLAAALAIAGALAAVTRVSAATVLREP